MFEDCCFEGTFWLQGRCISTPPSPSFPPQNGELGSYLILRPLYMSYWQCNSMLFTCIGHISSLSRGVGVGMCSANPSPHLINGMCREAVWSATRPDSSLLGQGNFGWNNGRAETRLDRLSWSKLTYGKSSTTVDHFLNPWISIVFSIVFGIPKWGYQLGAQSAAGAQHVKGHLPKAPRMRSPSIGNRSSLLMEKKGVKNMEIICSVYICVCAH